MGTSKDRPDTDGESSDDKEPTVVYEPTGSSLRSKDHTKQMMERTYLAIFGPEGSLAQYAKKLKYVDLKYVKKGRR